MSATQPPGSDFFIDRNDGRGKPIDPTLIAAAKAVWPRIRWMVEDALRDDSAAAELLERVVLRIAEAQHKKQLPKPLDSPKAILMVRSRDELNNEIRRARRISYVGTLTDLTVLAESRGENADSGHRIHARALIEELLAMFDEDVRHLATLRLAGYEWAEIAKELGGRAGTLRERFRVALRRLRDRLSSNDKSEGQEGN
ncbi:MAG: sigma-70 family RNA polymerase sigma factor [Bryobacterales bacterium]|nr:sigma-70 family RNA polymerase sigma factor [Bryobacterales bacterium]